MKPKNNKISEKRFLMISVVWVIAILLAIFIYLSWRDVENPANPQETNQPLACSLERAPVCGVDGKTYTNRCTAETTYSVRVAYEGACTVTEWTGQINEETWAEVDSGIENLENVPKFTTDRPGTGDEVDSTPASTGALEGTGQTQTGSEITYFNNTFRYGFSLPKNSYYTAFGAQDGASHSIGISTTATGAESLSGSEVRVYFYVGKILDQLKNAENGFTTDPATGTMYLLLNEANSVRIESRDQGSDIVQTIIRTIHMTE